MRPTRIATSFHSTTNTRLMPGRVLHERHASPGASAHAAAHTRPQPAGTAHRGLSSRATVAAPLGEAWTRRCGKPSAHLAAHHTSSSSPRSTRTSPRPPVWGTQQLNLFPDAKYDGVFAIWYGKGPGVDRCGDVFRHANAAGFGKIRRRPRACRRRSRRQVVNPGTPERTHPQSRHDPGPAIPANVQEYLDLRPARHRDERASPAAGSVMKCTHRRRGVRRRRGHSTPLATEDPCCPKISAMPANDAHALNIRWPDQRARQQEARVCSNHKVYAALAYCRANQFDRVVLGQQRPAARQPVSESSPPARPTSDVHAGARRPRNRRCAWPREVGIRVYKVAMPWPLEAAWAYVASPPVSKRSSSSRKKGRCIEYQIKEELYELARRRAPVRASSESSTRTVSGPLLPTGKPASDAWRLAAAGRWYELSVAHGGEGDRRRASKQLGLDQRLGEQFTGAPGAMLEPQGSEALAQALLPVSGVAAVQRTPYFCSGCPHNTSTQSSRRQHAPSPASAATTW
jgi:indolepyruvate ferredoxin oxidoreductase